MKIELTITRSDGKQLRFGEETADGIDDRSLIVLDTIFQHAASTIAEQRRRLARSLPVQWQDPLLVEVPASAPIEDDVRSQYADESYSVGDVPPPAAPEDFTGLPPENGQEQPGELPVPTPLAPEDEVAARPRATRGRAVKDSPQA